ncbi:YbbC/YhhH family protein [Dysgonomonas reticulitermitis]
MKITLSLLLLIVTMNCCSQNKQDNTERLVLGKEHAEKELRESLSDSLLHNVVNKDKILIDKEENAVKIAETILFPIYTEENIIRQRPYETYRINNYWVISGTLPKGYLGGVFLIILDARDGKVIRITHGK